MQKVFRVEILMVTILLSKYHSDLSFISCSLNRQGLRSLINYFVKLHQKSLRQNN